MDSEKILTFASMVVAGLMVLLFLLDLALGVFGRMILIDIMFILSGAFVLWQGIETIRELR